MMEISSMLTGSPGSYWQGPELYFIIVCTKIILLDFSNWIRIIFTIQIRQSLLRTATLLFPLRTLLFPLRTLLHTPFRSLINSKKEVWSKVCKGKSKVAVLSRLCLICIVNGMIFFNYDQKQCQESVQAATEQNHQKETLSINQKIKNKRLKKTRNTICWWLTTN